MMVRPPGVYVERGPGRAPPLGLMPSGIPCFLGLTERGPTNEPVRVASIEEFREMFGSLDVGTYLEASVDGFFLNGGTECHIVRIAHLFERGRKEVATKATARLRDTAKQNTLLVQAISEGMWGNQIRVSVNPTAASVQTFITVDARHGETQVSVKSTYGFARGSLIKIFDDNHAEYRIVHAVEGRNLTWTEKQPLEQDFLSMAPTMVEPVAFDLTLETHSQREVFRALNLARQAPQFIERVVNGRSKLATVTSLDSMSPWPENLPFDVAKLSLEGGTDGLYTVAAEDFIGADLGPGSRFGLAGLYDNEAIDLICMPDLPWCLQHSGGFKSAKDMEVVQQAVVAQCEEKGDRFAIFDFPPDTTPTGALQWRRLFDSSYCAFYYPYLVPSSRQDGKAMPSCGHVAGIYARCDHAAGVFRAPANEAFQGVVDLQSYLLPGDMATLNNEGINCVQVFAQRGIRVWGARTASSDAQLRYINVRRTIAAIARALQVGLQWVVFETNDDTLWSTVKRDVTFFLDDLWLKGYLAGGGGPEAFWVVCDDTINTSKTRDNGQLLVDVGLAANRPAEFIGVRVVQEIDVLAREDGSG
ncbi:MAG: phage tail sheath family protein [Myxococcales bacterium]|nr:phage tail sheath family protein [Myxococcales bacterium]